MTHGGRRKLAADPQSSRFLSVFFARPVQGVPSACHGLLGSDSCSCGAKAATPTVRDLCWILNQKTLRPVFSSERPGICPRVTPLPALNPPFRLRALRLGPRQRPQFAEETALPRP